MYENVIIIPFRRREPHLEIFIRDAVPLFQLYLFPFKVVVVEQEDGKLFNRGQLINIGFNEYKDKSKYIFTHDVDICPNEKCVRDIYAKIPTTDIMGIYTSCWDTLGGIIKMSASTYADINGFPNNYWGWGVEDKALQNRAVTLNKTISKNVLNNDTHKHDFFSIKNDINDAVRDTYFDARTSFEYDVFKRLDFSDRRCCVFTSGLNNLNYKVVDRYHMSDDIELIKVSI